MLPMDKNSENPEMRSVVAEPRPLPKYARGPFELLRHAHGHFLAARNTKDPHMGDVDRRVALVGFDNAIEVALLAHIRRNGDAATIKALNNSQFEKFYEKLNYLERHIVANDPQSEISLPLLRAIHNTRNKFYHEWDDNLPSLNSLEEARDEAVKVFISLFGHNPELLLQQVDPPISVPTNQAGVRSPRESRRPHSTRRSHTENDRETQVITSDSILFYGPYEQPYGCFSNYAKHSFRLDGKRWPTVEHYYQAQKYVSDSQYYDRIRHAATPSDAKRLGGDRARPYRQDWAAVKDDIMRRAVLAKFETNGDIRDLLLATGDVEIIENAPRDYYWGIGSKGTGQSMLGKILMETRALLRDKSR